MHANGAMTKKFGVALDDEIGEWIDSQLEYGDSRSHWIKIACELRRSVDKTLARKGMTFDSEHDKRAFVRQAILDKIRQETS